MLICFLDDSKTEAGWYARGGIVIESDNLLKLESDFLEILINYDIPTGDNSINTEVKWNPKKNNWIKKKLQSSQRVSFIDNVLDLIEKHHAKLFLTAIINVKDKNEGLKDCFIHTFERVNFYARHNKKTVLIICDQEDSDKHTKRIKHETFELVKKGSEYQSLEFVYKHAWMVESKYHAGIQLADLVVGITMDLILEKNNKYAENHWPKLKGNFIKLKEYSEPQKFSISIPDIVKRKNFINKYKPYTEV